MSRFVNEEIKIIPFRGYSFEGKKSSCDQLQIGDILRKETGEYYIVFSYKEKYSLLPFGEGYLGLTRMKELFTSSNLDELNFKFKQSSENHKFYKFDEKDLELEILPKKKK